MEEELGPPTDVYSLGVVCYELLTGAPPFQGKKATEVMVQHIYGRPPPLVQLGLAPWVQEVEHLVFWAMSKRPADRPTAAQLRDALASLQQRWDSCAPQEPLARTRPSRVSNAPTLRIASRPPLLWPGPVSRLQEGGER